MLFFYVLTFDVHTAESAKENTCTGLPVYESRKTAGPKAAF